MFTDSESLWPEICVEPSWELVLTGTTRSSHPAPDVRIAISKKMMHTDHSSLAREHPRHSVSIRRPHDFLPIIAKILLSLIDDLVAEYSEEVFRDQQPKCEELVKGNHGTSD